MLRLVAEPAQANCVPLDGRLLRRLPSQDRPCRLLALASLKLPTSDRRHGEWAAVPAGQWRGIHPLSSRGARARRPGARPL
jgi:hypothetical protein